MGSNEEKLEKLYDTVEKTAQAPHPKRSLFGMKCPKCGNKLSKETAKGTIFDGEGGTAFAKKVTAKAQLPVGVYTLAIEHFKCKQCDYEFAEADVSTVEE